MNTHQCPMIYWDENVSTAHEKFFKLFNILYLREGQNGSCGRLYTRWITCRSWSQTFPSPQPPTRHLFVTQVRIKCPVDWKPACRSHLHFHPDVKRFSLLFTWRLGGRWSQHCTPQHPSGQRKGSTSLWWDGKCSRGKLWGKGWAAGSRWWAEESGNLQSYEECCHLSSLSCYSASQCCLLSAVPLKDRTRHG